MGLCFILSEVSLVPPRPGSKTPRSQLLNPPEEIESMADSYFQRIYTAEQSIEEVSAGGRADEVVCGVITVALPSVIFF